MFGYLETLSFLLLPAKKKKKKGKKENELGLNCTAMQNCKSELIMRKHYDGNI